jgi:hypothetical protein
VFFCAILISLVVTVGASAQVTLNGNVQEDADKVVPVPNTRVVVNGSYSDTTDSIGQFSIKLSRDLIQGERVIIMVDRRGWVVNSPVDGDWNLPNFKTQNVQTTKVSIVPRGSMKLWSHERITKYVEKLSDELAKQKKEGEKPGPVDFTTYLDQYARQPSTSGRRRRKGRRTSGPGLLPSFTGRTSSRPLGSLMRRRGRSGKSARNWRWRSTRTGRTRATPWF